MASSFMNKPGGIKCEYSENIKWNYSQPRAQFHFCQLQEKTWITIHLSQASLKEYSDIIASAILNFIKNDLDLEKSKDASISKQCFIPRNYHCKWNCQWYLKVYIIKDLQGNQFSSKDNPNLFSQLTISNEISLGQRAQGKNTKLSLFSKYPLEQNQMALERESQKLF